MDDESSFKCSVEYLGNNLIEGNDLRYNSGQRHLQHQVGCRQLAGNGDAKFFHFIQRVAGFGDNHRAVALADAAAAGHQRVFFLDVGIGVEGNSGHIVKRFTHCFLIQRLDVGQRVGELIVREP